MWLGSDSAYARSARAQQRRARRAWDRGCRTPGRTGGRSFRRGSTRARAREAKRDQGQVVEVSGPPDPETGKSRRAAAGAAAISDKGIVRWNLRDKISYMVHGSFATSRRTAVNSQAERRGWARMRRIEGLRASRRPGCAGSPLRVSERIPSPIIIRLPDESWGPWLRRTNFASVGKALRLCDAQASADKWIPAFAGKATSDLRPR